MSQDIITIQYSGINLPITENVYGEYVIPLKPISDLFGLQWERQRKKILRSSYLRRFLGVCICSLPSDNYQNRSFNCIHVSRVEAYLISINPNKVRAHGNISGADYLEERIIEWMHVVKKLESIKKSLLTATKENTP